MSPSAIAGAFIITPLTKSNNVMREQVRAPAPLSEPGREMNKDPSQAVEVAGLSKIEAEDLLDLLEAKGCELCQLSFIDGEGFSVRPTSRT